MSATYDETLPTALDRARALLGDTAVATPLLSDAHISAVLALMGGFEAGVAWLADELAARFAQRPDSLSDAGSSLRWSERVAQWRLLAERMRAGDGAATARAATGARVRHRPRPDYTLAGGDQETGA